MTRKGVRTHMGIRHKDVLWPYCFICKVELTETNTRSSERKANVRRCAECARQDERNRSQALRQELLKVYGGQCSCCGEAEWKFLTLEHTNNDGAADRKRFGDGGTFYKWLRKNGFPQEGLTLLCWNCNCSKGMYGRCPHQDEVSHA
jgi:hypothetical protein